LTLFSCIHLISHIYLHEGTCRVKCYGAESLLLWYGILVAHHVYVNLSLIVVAVRGQMSQETLVWNIYWCLYAIFTEALIGIFEHYKMCVK